MKNHKTKIGVALTIALYAGLASTNAFCGLPYTAQQIFARFNHALKDPANYGNFFGPQSKGQLATLAGCRKQDNDKVGCWLEGLPKGSKGAVVVTGKGTNPHSVMVVLHNTDPSRLTMTIMSGMLAEQALVWAVDPRAGFTSGRGSETREDEIIDRLNPTKGGGQNNMVIADNMRFERNIQKKNYIIKIISLIR